MKPNSGGVGPLTAAVALLGVALLASVSFYNLYLLRNTSLIGSYLPVGVFGSLIVYALIRWAFVRRGGGSPAGVGAVAAVLLFACGVVGASLLDHASTLLMLPWRLDRLSPEWRGDPALPEDSAFRDDAALARALLEGAGAPAGDPARAFARRLPEALVQRLRAAGENLDTDTRCELHVAVRAALTDPTLADDIAGKHRPPLPGHIRRILRKPPADRTDDERLRLNRALLDAAFPRAIAPRRPAAIELAPPIMLADPRAAPDPERALDGFAAGLAEPNRPFGFNDVPWAAWRRTLLFWGLMAAAMIALATGLALVVHRQWAEHERLPYPIVEVTRALLPEPGQRVAAVFRQPMFWGAFSLVLGVHLANYAQRWWPDYVIPVPLELELRPLLQIFPVMQRHMTIPLFRPTVYFTAIGLTYFLASDVGFSLGAGPYLYSILVGIAAGLGVTFSGGFLAPSLQSQFNAGAYMAMFLALIWAGRHYYLVMVRGALGLATGESAAPGAVWGARLAALGFLGFVGLLIAAGVEPAPAALYTSVAVMIFTVLSRLLAEAGVFYMHPVFFPCVVLWSFLGTQAVGYEQLLALGLATAMFLSDPKDALMPFAVMGLRLAERCGARPAAIARWGAVGAALALLIGTPVMILLQYQHGALNAGHPWMQYQVPRGPFARAATMMRALQAQGALSEANTLRGLERFHRAAPQRAPVIAFGVFFGLTLLFTALRHRFARWPLHPLIFLTMTTYQSALMAFSVLVGWLVKRLVMQYGGARAYQRLKPLMIGLVAGEVLSAAVPLIVGVLYAAVTGRPPRQIAILPG